jgi:hypothetical protein
VSAPGPEVPEQHEAKKSPCCPRLKWSQMRLLGSIQFFKVSYAVLVLVPLLALLQHVIPLPESLQDLRKMPLLLRLGYFSALLLSCAHMLYQGYCPAIIKRFDSPNDLYREMLEIKSLQKQYLSEDTAFTFDILHCRRGFAESNVQHSPARVACWICYVGGASLFGIVVLIQSLRVVGVFV